MSETQLLDHLRARAEMLRSTARVVPAEIAEAADRWVLASLLQKAIRRGEAELALGAALKLLERDPSRLWRRLMTTALEDVGIGDLDVALDLVAVSSLPMARKALGGSLRSLEILVPLACAAVKDRTADHLASLVRWQKASEIGKGRVGPEVLKSADGFCVGLSEQSAASETGKSSISAAGSPWQEHLYGLCALEGAWQRLKLGLTDVINYFARQDVPAVLLQAAAAYARRCGDPLFLYALTAWVLWREQAPEPLALARPRLCRKDLGAVPDYALDPLRTRLGRRAVELWLRSYLEKLPFDAGAVTAGLWNSEAALCNQILFWKAGGEIQKAAHQADLLHQGLPLERHAELFAWIAQESSVLGAARQMVWQSHVRQLLVERQSAPAGWDRGGGDGDRTSQASSPAATGNGLHKGSHASAAKNPTRDGRFGLARGEPGPDLPAHAPPESGGDRADSDEDDGGSAAHHTVYTPYLPR